MVLREEGDWEGMDGELDLVGSEVEGQPGRVSHQERAVEMRCKGFKVWSEGGSGVGSVTDKECD